MGETPFVLNLAGDVVPGVVGRGVSASMPGVRPGVADVIAGLV
jgi:hypothetical protein